LLLSTQQLQPETGENGTAFNRILLAESDDVNAFVLHYEMNRISRACAIQRANKPEALAAILQRFRPELLVLSGAFAEPGQVSELCAKHPDLIILCISPTTAQAEANLSAGARDCLLASQSQSFAACLERHLNGTFEEAAYKSPVVPRHSALLEEGFSGKADRLWKVVLERTRAKVAEAGCAAAALGAATQQTVRSWRETGTVQRLVAKLKAENLRAAASLNQNDVFTSEFRESISDFSDALLDLSPERIKEEADNDPEALRHLELALKTVLHCAFDSIFLLDQNGRFVYVNPAGCSLLGGSTPDLLGRRFMEFLPPEEIPEAMNQWELLLIEGEQKGELRLRTSDQVGEVSYSARTNFWFGVHLLIIREKQAQ